MENMRFENVWRVLRNYCFELNSEISNELICTICKKIMINACNSPCGCRYCNDCLKNYLQRTEKFCPGESDDCKNVLINFDRNVYIDQPINAKIAQLQMKCPENCSDCLIELREMENHIRVCNRQRRFCPFTNIGCTDRDLIEINMKQHLLTEIHNHSNLMVQSIENLQNEIDILKRGINEIKLEIKQTIFQRILSMFSEKKMIFQLFLIFIFCFAFINFLINNTLIGMRFQQNNQSEMIDLHSKLERLVERLKLLEINDGEKHKVDHTDQIEFTWIINKFHEKQKNAETGTVLEIFSDPFFSHKNGYKLQLQMNPNGGETAKGKYISVYFCIMKGDNDDSLQWPFKYNITLELINQQTNTVHIRYIVTYDQLPNHQNWDKPKSFRNIGIGYHHFLPLDDLKSEAGLIENDQVVVKCIVHIPTNNSINPEQVNGNQFTWIISKFSEKRKDAESESVMEIYSDPFYSHKNGYKMNLAIYPNGYGESKGKYISIYFCIMKGRFDDQLTWPFKMKVTIELINQHTNSLFSYVIFDNNTLADHPNRNKPTTFRNNLLGYRKFIEFKELFDTPGLILNDQIMIRARTEM